MPTAVTTTAKAMKPMVNASTARGYGPWRLGDTPGAVSEQNIDLVRRIYDAWEREESTRDFIAADVEYVNPSYAVESGTLHGRKSFALVRETYEDFKIRIERFIDAGADEVVVLARYTASGRGSGVPLEGEHGYVWTVQDGLAVRFRWFQSHREALEAAGLEDQGER
jgi:ketosteroid isomerase-like protein